jgi:hypothetical protein
MMRLFWISSSIFDLILSVELQSHSVDCFRPDRSTSRVIAPLTTRLLCHQHSFATSDCSAVEFLIDFGIPEVGKTPIGNDLHSSE